MKKHPLVIGWIWVLINGVFLAPAATGQTIIYVDPNAPGVNNGASWANAFNFLQDALTAAQYGDEIRVAEGIYTPDKGAGFTPGDREATFALLDGVNLYGGFAGFGADNPNLRNPDLYLSVLSGDLFGDDNPVLLDEPQLSTLIGIGRHYHQWEPGSPFDLDGDEDIDFGDVMVLLEDHGLSDNSVNVISADRYVLSAVLDGFTISGGCTQGYDMYVPYPMGAGLYNDFGGPMVNDCDFRDNLAFFIPGADAVRAGGGALYTSSGNPSVTNCNFYDNLSWGGDGGGIYNSSTGWQIINCSFQGNTAIEVFDPWEDKLVGGHGGGIYNGGGNLDIVGGIFVNNRATKNGGGLYNIMLELDLADCWFSNNTGVTGGGMYNSADYVTLVSCDFYQNTAIEGGGLYNWSNYSLIITDGTIEEFAGSTGMDTEINLGSEGGFTVVDTLTLGGDTLVTGSDTVTVEFGGELILDDMAVFNMMFDGEKGTLQCDGFLRAKAYATLINTNLNVARSSFENHARVMYNIITTIGENPIGQFSINEGVAVVGNEIHTIGDNFMDLNPAAFYGVLSNNQVYVTIIEGVDRADGGLLELRGLDGLVNMFIPDPNNDFFRRVPPGTIPPFEPNSWSLAELRLIDNAKVTLMNQFDYQPPFGSGGKEEVVYVKNLILGENAVLNTSFNHIYYENLVAAPGAAVQNIPLMGISLGRLNLNSDLEFLHRVNHNNYINEAHPEYNRIHVERVFGLPPRPEGMMHIINHLDRDPASESFGLNFNAQAKTEFAATSESEILLRFQYLLNTNFPEQELVIYVSDIPEMLGPNDPQRQAHYFEVGRLQQLPLDRPGAFGSGRLGVFQREISPMHLDFSGGLWIEFDMTGPPDSSMFLCSISPMVLCDPLQLYCKDVSGDFGVTAKDYLTIFGEYGHVASPDADPSAPMGRACLDGSFNRDGYLDLHDLLEWDWFLSPPDRLNSCDIPLVEGQTTSTALHVDMGRLSRLDNEYFLAENEIIASHGSDESFLIASKWIHNISPYYIQDTMYLFDQNGQTVGSVPPAFAHKGSRLIKDKDNNVYQIHLENGLVGLWDPNAAIIPPASFTGVTDPRYSMSASVHVGLQYGTEWTGRPLFDAAIDDQGYIYVLPVVVVPDGLPDWAYTAAAQLEPKPAQTPPYDLVKLFDDPPPPGDNQERNALREIEVDDHDNLYIVNSHELNESDILWIYDTTTAAIEQKINLMDCNLPAPTAMYISEDNQTLYMASSQNDPNSDTTTLVGLSAADLSTVRTVTINDMGHVTCIAENPTNGTIWAAGFKMPLIPQYPDPGLPAFYYPYLAEIPLGSTGPVTAMSLTGATDMSLPMSMIWIGGGKCAGADANGDGKIDLADFYIMCQYWLAEGCTDSQPCGKVNLDNSDNNFVINLADFAVFAQYWLRLDCNII